MQNSLLYYAKFIAVQLCTVYTVLKDDFRGNEKHVRVWVHRLVLAEFSAGYPPIQLGKPPT
jgi:hypothetical protein